MQAGDNVMPQIRQVTEIIYKGGHMIATDWFAAPFAFDKFCAVCDENSDVPGFLASLAPDMTAIDRGHGLYECVPTGFDKAWKRTGSRMRLSGLISFDGPYRLLSKTVGYSQIRSKLATDTIFHFLPNAFIIDDKERGSRNDEGRTGCRTGTGEPETSRG